MYKLTWGKKASAIDFIWWQKKAKKTYRVDFLIFLAVAQRLIRVVVVAVVVADDDWFHFRQMRWNLLNFSL